MRSGGAILQSRQSFAAISVNPLPNGPRADACGFGNGLRRLPAINLSYNPLSTARREPGILVHVHPVLPRIAEASQLQLPRPGPGGQPDESSQLADGKKCLQKKGDADYPCHTAARVVGNGNSHSLRNGCDAGAAR